MDSGARLYDQDFEARGMAEKYRLALQACRGAGRILEIGCNTGRLLSLCKESGSDVFGVELDPEAAAEAERRGIPIIQGDVESFGAREKLDSMEPFDRILLLDILEHTRNPWSVLSHLIRRLASNGVIILTLPNVAYYRVRIDLVRGRFWYTPAGILDVGHLRFFTLASARKLIHDCGLREQRFVPQAGETSALSRRFAARFPGLFAKVLYFELGLRPTSS